MAELLSATNTNGIESLELNRRNLVKGAMAVTAGGLLLPTVGMSEAEAAGAGRRFVANFVFPHSTLNQNKAIFTSMRTDAISFGGHLRYPTAKDGIPDVIKRQAGGKRILFYTNPLIWVHGYGHGHRWMWANSTYDRKRYAWDIVHAGNSVVISKNTGSNDGVRHLIEAARQTGYRAYVGLPAPAKQSKATWLPDTSYLWDYQAFVEKLVINYRNQGAAGFYHSLEMTLSDNFNTWRPAWDTYWAASRAIRSGAGHNITSIISPYLEARSHKAFKTPAQVARTGQWFHDLAHGTGTNLVVSPQDGLGTGSTALYADRVGGYVARTEDYFKALKNTLGNRLYATTECMTPGGGTPQTRGITTKSRISQQLWTVGTYTQGNIGYSWNHYLGYGMNKVPQLGSSWSAGTGRLG